MRKEHGKIWLHINNVIHWFINNGGLFKVSILVSVILLWGALRDVTELIKMSNNNIELLFDLIKALHGL